MRLLAEIVQDRLNGPRIPYDAWAAGQISNDDLRGLIPDTWLYVDWPERIIGAGKWVVSCSGLLTIVSSFWLNTRHSAKATTKMAPEMISRLRSSSRCSTTLSRSSCPTGRIAVATFSAHG